MPAKYWVLPLFALTVLAFGAHGSARADQEQFVVIVNTSPPPAVVPVLMT